MNLRVVVAIGIILFLIVVLRDKLGLGEQFCKWFGMDSGDRKCIDGALEPEDDSSNGGVVGDGNGGNGGGIGGGQPDVDPSDEPPPPWISGPSIPDRPPPPDPITDTAYVAQQDCITYYLREDPYAYATRSVMVPSPSEPGYENRNLTFDDLSRGAGLNFSDPFMIADHRDRIPVEASAMPDWEAVFGIAAGTRYTMYQVLFRYFGDINAVVTAFREADNDDFSGTHLNLPYGVPLITPFDAMFLKKQPQSIAEFFESPASNLRNYEMMGNAWDNMISRGDAGNGPQYTPIFDWLSSYIATLETGTDSLGRDLSVMGKPKSYGVVDNGNVLSPLGGLGNLETPRGPWRLALRPAIVELFAGTIPLVDESTATRRFLGDAKWLRLHRRYNNLWRSAFGVSYTHCAQGLMNLFQADIRNSGSFSSLLYLVGEQIAVDQVSPNTMLELLRYVLFWLKRPTYEDQSLCEGAA